MFLSQYGRVYRSEVVSEFGPRLLSLGEKRGTRRVDGVIERLARPPLRAAVLRRGPSGPRGTPNRVRIASKSNKKTPTAVIPGEHIVGRRRREDTLTHAGGPTSSGRRSRRRSSRFLIMICRASWISWNSFVRSGIFVPWTMPTLSVLLLNVLAIETR